ncbi:MAG: alpha/beta hydrolase [Colwellia sp.]|nr:alpha/beta hydrolase [Colwellia sp.]MCW8865563.1 alpha/beta hydrolase [Colwellia sp.]MCW9080196.1 alpha/beta hydrolase [Colwellia sp.]
MINKIAEVSFSLETLSIQGLVTGCEEKKDNIVLCLHGWLDNAASFSPMLPYLRQDLTDKHIVAIDWPGHGCSTHRSLDAHYHFIDWVYDLLQLFELKNWQQVDIVAHSMGGMVASAFAAAFPEKVKSLTLIDSIGFISAKAEQTTKQLRDGMLSRYKSSHKIRQNKTKKLHPNTESAIKARLSVSDLKYEQAKILVERGLLEEGEGFSWRSDTRLRNTSPYRLTLKQAQQFIRDIKCPVQLIYGSKGMDMVNSGIKHFGPLFEQFTSHQLAGGHHVHMEQPQKTSALIQHFLAE